MEVIEASQVLKLINSARLEFERTQRRQMNETVQKLKGEKRSYQVTICEKKLGLTALKPQLKAILEKSRSVQARRGRPFWIWLVLFP